MSDVSPTPDRSTQPALDLRGQGDFDPHDLPWAGDEGDHRQGKRSSKRPRLVVAVAALAILGAGATAWAVWPEATAPSDGSVAEGGVAAGGVAGGGSAASSTSDPASTTTTAPKAPATTGSATTAPGTTAAGTPNSTKPTAAKPTATPKPTSTVATAAPSSAPIDLGGGEEVGDAAELFAGTEPGKAIKDVAFTAWKLDGFEGTDPTTGATVAMELDDPANPETVTCRYAGPVDDPGASPFLGTCAGVATSQADIDATVSGWVISVAEGEAPGTVSSGGFEMELSTSEASTSVVITPKPV